MSESPKPSLESLPSIVKMRPMLMLTGFLGAGKTTLLRELLGHLNTREILADVILNDRENAYIDKATLDDHAAAVEALTGSCVCCEGFDFLIDLVLKASQSKHHALLIELNGTADPVPLQESFTLLESKFCLRPRWQVCVIDARSFRKRRRYNDLESLQLETASHYYISWDSDLSEEDLSRVEADIKLINPKASRTTPALLAELLEQAILKNSGQTLARQTPSKPLQSPTHFRLSPLPKDEPLDDAHEKRHQLAHEFTGCVIIFPKPVEKEKITLWLDQLPDSVIRAKALLNLSDEPDRLYLYERVGLITSPKPISARRKTEQPCSGIFIGADLIPDEILKITQEHLQPECHFPDTTVS